MHATLALIALMPATQAVAQAKVTDLVVMRRAIAAPKPKATPTPTPTPTSGRCQALTFPSAPSVSTSIDVNGNSTITTLTVGNYSGADWKTKIPELCSAKSTRAVFCYAIAGNANLATATWTINILTGSAAPKYIGVASNSTYAAGYCS